MNISKELSLLGLAAKAGRVVSGEFATEKAVKAGKARLVLVAGEMCIRDSITSVENAAEAVYEEKKIEEMEVVFLMDRFGYARTIDKAAYERNKETADSENKYIFSCMNTDKICVFTDSGRMHTIKVLDLPFGKFRDKGTPIDNVSNFDSSAEQMVFVLSLIHI